MKNTEWFLMIIGLISPIFISCSSTKFKSCETALELSGNPTTGYTWIYAVEDESVIQVDEEITYLGKEGMVGAPSLFTYRVHSLRPGNTKIKFEYKRPWETKAPEETRVYSVTVKENGHIMLQDNKESEMKTFRTVSMEEGVKLMTQDKDFVLLDVRTPEEYAEGHIPGAVQLTNETFTKDDAEEVIRDKNQTVYCYCRSGRRVINSCQKLLDYGYTDVINIGGILSYKGEIER